MNPRRRIGVLSRGILRIPRLEVLLGAEVVALHPWSAPRALDAIAGWGRRPGTERARSLAARLGLPFLALEDGFLRSLGLGSVDPPLSIVSDDEGVYYDAGGPSRLERLVRAPLGADESARAAALRAAWVRGRVSKYNAAREVEEPLPEHFVLVVDQTRGDASVRYGAAGERSFARMLEAALDENPRATVLLKTHPDVRAGRSRGYFGPESLPRDPRLQSLRTDAHIAGLIERAQAVYTVTSQAGFEALLWGRRARVFGMPFYAGWGISVDEQAAPARRAAVTLEQLVHAALLRYPRYVDPDSGAACEAETVLEHLALQRRVRARVPAEVHALGFSPWKRPLVRGFLQGARVVFHGARARVPAGATAVAWGRRETPGIAPGMPVIRLEDGFLRSVGLGADLVRPLSWAMDTRGMYYDASAPSLLEELLQTAEFDEALLDRARRLRERIVAAGLSKYNLPGKGWQPPAGARQVVLVPGQVESDAAVRYGGGRLRSNHALLEAVRARCPDAWLVYKPHPDVTAGLRRRGPDEDRAAGIADELVPDVAITELFASVDEVHVLTSLAGFEALLRGRRVVCHGQPFYGGWGLTEDLDPVGRRTRHLPLDALVAAVLILYPCYRSPRTGRFISAEQALDELEALRARRPALPERAARALLRQALRLRARWTR
jgi:capsular polysaccharide export protein